MILKLNNQQLTLIRFRLEKLKEEEKELREKQSRESIDPWELVALSNEEMTLNEILEKESIDLSSIY